MAKDFNVYEDGKQGIIECGDCGARVTRKSGTHKFCDECSADRRRKQTQKHVARHREMKPVAVEPLPVDIALVSQDPWKNLMLAVLAQAKEDGDQEYLDEFGPLYRDAITPKEARDYGKKKAQKLT